MRFPIKITENFLLAPVLHTFGVNEENSFAALDDGKLAVKMGRWFDYAIPISEIAALGPSEWPWWAGLGVKLHHHGLGVVGSTDGIVNVKFKTPLHMKAIFSVECEQLWLSLVDRDAFLAAVSAAAKVPIADHLPF